MNLGYLLPPLIPSIIGYVLLLVLLVRGRRRPERDLFAAIIITTTIWGLLTFAMRASPGVEQALIWDRAIMPVVFAQFIRYYHFSLVITGRPERKILLAAYSVLALSFVFHQTSFFIDRIDLARYGYAPHMAIGVYLLFPVGYTLIGMAVYNLISGYRRAASYEEKNRYLYLVIGLALPFIGVTLDAFPILYPMGIFGNIIFCIMASVAILRYHLLDVHLVVRRGTAYLLMSAMIALPYVGIIIGASQGLGGRFPLWGYVIILIVLAFALRPLWQRVQSLVDRLFFRQRYDFLRALEEFGQQIKEITDFDHLASSLTELIGRAMQLSSVGLLMPSVQMGEYHVVSSWGLGTAEMPYRLPRDSPFIRWMEENNTFLESRYMDIRPELQALSLSEREALWQLHGELYFPLKVREKLAGILVLGHKRSQQFFNSDDLRLLSAVGNQVAVSLDNARLYQTEKQQANDLARLQQSSARLSTELDIDLLSHMVTEEVARLLDADAAALFVVDDENGLAVFKTGIGLAFAHEGTGTPLAKFTNFIAQELVDNFKQGSTTITISDVRGNPSGEIPEVVQEDIRSILAIPVVRSGQPVNVIAVFSKHVPRRFAEEDVNLARTFAYHAALAMENAHLYGVERQQRLELERLDDMRQSFFAAVSHELKTPLTSIVGATQMMLEETASQSNSPQHKLLSIIDRNAERMEKRIQELLDFVKIQSATLKLDRKPEDINRAVEETTALSLPALWARKQTLRVKLMDSSITVMLDRSRFEQIMANLLSNASKYSPQNSEITVEARMEDSRVVVNVSDRGPGIPAEHRERIFEPYFRGEKNTTSGLGIGLTIAKSLTELHGGEMWVDEREGGGSVFSFSLPLGQGEPA